MGTCTCAETFCGKNCQRTDPCLEGTRCKNEGVCVPACDKEPFYTCTCPAGWEGRNCHLKSSTTEELALIVGPIVGGMAFIALVGLIVFWSWPGERGRGRVTTDLLNKSLRHQDSSLTTCSRS